ncbi:hypothetical protein Ppa06_34640 [Planomonospora parontospora subsp. parontospora]|uniref:Uncharacterized protein n=2 Tax=Planomonospora parontospora TaxID=58119 RepID=A0AA37BI27_9ACTN|nr:hypothetical protein [Planomonospora parontospora]GGK73734.1 hypothetical protein GCM10010126_36440 [Planomonospora parontospora]GII09666.1 hypothetical protein Ppa06_34640 [Planomonospora parontospora subsp. parontospora]
MTAAEVVTARRGGRVLERLGGLLPYAAALWCLAYGTLAVYWASGGAGFPLGVGDPRAEDMGSWLAAAEPGPTGLVIALGCAAGLVAALGGRSLQTRRIPRRAAAAVLLAAAAPLLLVVPDVRVLQSMAYGLQGYVGLVDWPVVNQLLCALGGALLAGTAASLLSGPRCPRCDRPHAAPGAAARWARIGRWATAVAVVAPLPYAVQRAVWVLGIPLGVDRRFIHDLLADLEAKALGPLVVYGLPLSAAAGALLTLGLSMRWGTVLPEWVPYLGGRRVPVAPAVVPAAVVTVAVITAGMAPYRQIVLDGLPVTGSGAPALLWLPWGIGLGLATLAYQRRRRETCSGR